MRLSGVEGHSLTLDSLAEIRNGRSGWGTKEDDLLEVPEVHDVSTSCSSFSGSWNPWSTEGVSEKMSTPASSARRHSFERLEADLLVRPVGMPEQLASPAPQDRGQRHRRDERRKSSSNLKVPGRNRRNSLPADNSNALGETSITRRVGRQSTLPSLGQHQPDQERNVRAQDQHQVHAVHDIAKPGESSWKCRTLDGSEFPRQRPNTAGRPTLQSQNSLQIVRPTSACTIGIGASVLNTGVARQIPKATELAYSSPTVAAKKRRDVAASVQQPEKTPDRLHTTSRFTNVSRTCSSDMLVTPGRITPGSITPEVMRSPGPLPARKRSNSIAAIVPQASEPLPPANGGTHSLPRTVTRASTMGPLECEDQGVSHRHGRIVGPPQQKRREANLDWVREVLRAPIKLEPFVDLADEASTVAPSDSPVRSEKSDPSSTEEEVKSPVEPPSSSEGNAKEHRRDSPSMPAWRQLLKATEVRRKSQLPKLDGSDDSEADEPDTPTGKEYSKEVLLSAFKRLMDDGEIHKDSLPQALELIGLHAVTKWVDEVFQAFSVWRSTLDFQEFRDFVRAYCRRRHAEYFAAFKKLDRDNSGALDAREIKGLLLELGLQTIDVHISRIFEEVGKNATGEIEFTEFERLCSLLQSREGFSRQEYQRLLATFRLFDADRSGTLDAAEATRALEYLHYSLGREEDMGVTAGFFEKVNLDVKDTLSERDWLVFMRKVRDCELSRIGSCISRVEGCTRHDFLCRLLLALGYIPNPDAVLDAAQDAGIKPANDIDRCVMQCDNYLADGSTKPADGEVWLFLEAYRQRQGMSRDEHDDNAEVFRQFRAGEKDVPADDRRLSNIEVGKALRWLGWASSHEVQQQLIQDADIMSAGRMSLTEFQRLIRLYQERELRGVRKTIKEVCLNAGESMHSRVSEHEAVLALRAMGCCSERSCSSEPRRSIDPRKSRKRDGVQDVYSVICQATKQLRAFRAQFRHNQGFSKEEVDRLKHIFDSYDRDGNGDIGKQELADLLKDLFPDVTNFQPILKEIDLNGDGALDFFEYMHVLRVVRDRRVSQLVQKELRAVKKTQFSSEEVKEFRAIFIEQDIRGKDTLSFGSFVRLLQGICALGASRMAELHTLWDETVEHSEEAQTDFPDFLLLMRQLLDRDFAGLQSGLSNAAGRQNLVAKPVPK